MIGIFTICGGLVLVTLGVGCLFVHVALGRIKRQLSWGSLARGCALPLTLLLINFPAAFGFAWAAIAIETRYVVSVTNESSATVSGFVVRGGGCAADFGMLKPGERRSRGFYIQNDGELRYQGILGSSHIDGVVDGYVTPSQGGHKDILITSHGIVEVRGEGT